MAETPPSLPSELPVLPLRRTVGFPLTLQPLAVNRPVSIESVQKALAGDRMIVLLLQDNDADDPTPNDLRRVGTVGIIRQMARTTGGINIIVEGVSRVRAEVVTRTASAMRAQITPLPEKYERTIEVEAHVRRIQELIEKALSLAAGLSEELRAVVLNIEDPLRLAYVLGTLIDMKPEEKQQLLEENDLVKKLQTIATALTREVSLLELKGKIESQAQQEMTDAQRQYYLRQQLKAIQQELGEGEGNEIADLRKRVDEARLPEHAAKVAARELDRLGRMGPQSPEYQMIRTYIDWLLDVPWPATTPDRIDPVEARTVLDEDHYDLDKVKERIVEYLAVRKLKGDMKGPILCFVGPPGVGKTSLGQSIARAMNRKFVRVSLGGVHDEAEIRGHRRTYIGALPGNIIQAIRKAGSRNCVMMLDEIDKLGAGIQGDPRAALLEVLDPEQNNTFRDNYLGVPFDLSRVVFLTTANMLEGIPGPLRDRMEVISLAGYTAEEKLQIARRYLVRRQMEANGLKEGQADIADDAIRQTIQHYTREAGVRNLEREIGRILRHAAVRIAEGQGGPIRIGTDDLAPILGAPRFESEVAMRTSIPGVATGLAWTPVGGEILFIEATRMAGSGKLILTGQLGGVMKESAQAALSILKNRAASFGIDPERFDRFDIHVHVPAGATPKDCPSAGVAMFMALVSLFSGRTVRSDTAMTGEISLRGLVLPVGGVKEKVVAAHRAGIKRVMLPARNRKDFEDIPEEARKEIEFLWLERVDEAVAAALDPARQSGAEAAQPAEQAVGA